MLDHVEFCVSLVARGIHAFFLTIIASNAGVEAKQLQALLVQLAMVTINSCLHMDI